MLSQTQDIIDTVMAKHLDTLLHDLSEKHWSVIDDFLPIEAYDQLCRAIDFDNSKGLLIPATIGRNKEQRKDIRGDVISWIQREGCNPDALPAFELIEALQLALKHELRLALDENECHFAIYPVGSIYAKHSDCHKNQNSRILTFILYLNKPLWLEAQGGQLRMWLTEGKTQEILPKGNRIVMFDSGEFDHEVLVSTSIRKSFTGWMRREIVSI